MGWLSWGLGGNMSAWLYSQCRIVISATRSTKGEVQLSEVEFYDTTGTQLAVASAANPGGDSPDGSRGGGS